MADDVLLPDHVWVLSGAGDHRQIGARFTDQNASDVTFNATFDGHLETTSSDGTKIIVFRHFEEDLDAAIEGFGFADGTVISGFNILDYLQAYLGLETGLPSLVHEEGRAPQSAQ